MDFKSSLTKQQKSRSQQVAEDFSDDSGTLEPLDWRTFLELYRDRMLDEEIEELGTV